MSVGAYSPVSRIKGDLNEEIFIPQSAANDSGRQIKAHANSDGSPFKDSGGTAATLAI